MYSFSYSSFITIGNKKQATLSIFFDNYEVSSSVVKFDVEASQEALDNYANSVIDVIEGIE